MAPPKLRRNIFRLVLLLLILTLIFNFANPLKILYPMPFQEQIFASAAEFNVDPYFLAALTKTESSFQPEAVSPVGARGLMQIMPETGDWIAEQMHLEFYNQEMLFDPDINIRMGAWYVADLEREFAGNKIMVLAAYNGGRSNVAQWLKERRISGHLTDIDSIPFPETRNFVGKVMLDYNIYVWIYRGNS